MNRLGTAGGKGMLEMVGCAAVLRMYADFRQQAKVPVGRAEMPLLNVALVYEDSIAGSRALRTFRNLFDTGADPVEFNLHNAWKFDFLRIQRLREAAIAETVRADLVIISMGDARELPPPVKDWLEASLEQRDGDPGALVLLHEARRRDESTPLPVETHLAECAGRAGMDFFLKGPDLRRVAEARHFQAGSREAAAIGNRIAKPAMAPFCRSLKPGRLGRR